MDKESLALAHYYLDRIVECLDKISTELGGPTFAEADALGVLSE